MLAQHSWTTPRQPPRAETENEGQGSCQSGIKRELLKQDVPAYACIYLDQAQNKCHQLGKHRLLKHCYLGCSYVWLCYATFKQLSTQTCSAVSWIVHDVCFR